MLMRMKSLSGGLLAGAAVCAVAVSGLSLQAYAATFIAFDPPESVATFALSISNGAITGEYQVRTGDIYGFVRDANNSITSFNAGGSETIGESINNAGTITGNFYYSSAVSHGFAPADPRCGHCSFVRTADGTITTFVPCGVGGWAFAINAGGAIAGTCLDYSDGFHGYVRAAGGKTTKFDPAGSTLTWATSINDSGVITGWYYTESNKRTHGFVRAADGSITTFDPLQSTDTGGTSINDAGTVTGRYEDSSGTCHGLARTANGTITTFDPSGSTCTIPASIGKSDAIAGSYIDGTGASHGFVREPSGSIRSFDPPLSSQTYPASIDSAPAGRNAITGYYQDRSGTYHGFLRRP